MKTKLQGRIKDLEEDLKKTREDLEKKNQAAQEQENEVINLMHAEQYFPILLATGLWTTKVTFNDCLQLAQACFTWIQSVHINVFGTVCSTCNYRQI